MAKAELGTKRRCLSCAASFFDLNRTPVLCPKCGAAFQIVEYPRSRPKWAPSFPIRPRKSDAADPELVEPEIADTSYESAIPPNDEDDDSEAGENLESEHDRADTSEP